MKQLTLIKVAGVVASLAAFGGGMAHAQLPDAECTLGAEICGIGEANNDEILAENEEQKAEQFATGSNGEGTNPGSGYMPAEVTESSTDTAYSYLGDETGSEIVLGDGTVVIGAANDTSGVDVTITGTVNVVDGVDVDDTADIMINGESVVTQSGLTTAVTTAKNYADENDADTQLTEAQVDAYADNNGYAQDSDVKSNDTDISLNSSAIYNTNVAVSSNADDIDALEASALSVDSDGVVTEGTGPATVLSGSWGSSNSQVTVTVEETDDGEWTVAGYYDDSGEFAGSDNGGPIFATQAEAEARLAELAATDAYTVKVTAPGPEIVDLVTETELASGVDKVTVKATNESGTRTADTYINDNGVYVDAEVTYTNDDDTETTVSAITQLSEDGISVDAKDGLGTTVYTDIDSTGVTVKNGDVAVTNGDVTVNGDSVVTESELTAGIATESAYVSTGSGTYVDIDEDSVYVYTETSETLVDNYGVTVYQYEGEGDVTVSVDNGGSETLLNNAADIDALESSSVSIDANGQVSTGGHVAVYTLGDVTYTENSQGGYDITGGTGTTTNTLPEGAVLTNPEVNLVTESELATAISTGVANVDLTGLATEDYVDTAKANAISTAAADAADKANTAKAAAITAAAADATAKAEAALVKALADLAAVKATLEAKDVVLNDLIVETRETLEGAIEAEEAARIAADNALQAEINAEAATRAAEDAKIRAELAEERAERIAADAAQNVIITSNTNRIITLEDQWNTDPVLGNYDISKVTGQRTRIEVANGVFEYRVARVEDIKTIADRVADNTSRIQRLENAVFVNDDNDSALDRLKADLWSRAKIARANNAADYVMTSAGLVDLRGHTGGFSSHAGGTMISLSDTMAYDILGLGSTWVALK